MFDFSKYSNKITLGKRHGDRALTLDHQILFKRKILISDYPELNNLPIDIF